MLIVFICFSEAFCRSIVFYTHYYIHSLSHCRTVAFNGVVDIFCFSFFCSPWWVWVSIYFSVLSLKHVNHFSARIVCMHSFGLCSCVFISFSTFQILQSNKMSKFEIFICVLIPIECVVDWRDNAQKQQENRIKNGKDAWNNNRLKLIGLEMMNRRQKKYDWNDNNVRVYRKPSRCFKKSYNLVLEEKNLHHHHHRHHHRRRHYFRWCYRANAELLKHTTHLMCDFP